MAGNTTPTAREIKSFGTFFSDGYNLFGVNGSSGLVDATPAASDKILPGPINTAIGPLANNGGPTLTHLPVAGSLLVNGGNDQLIPAGVTNDQRGAGFPRIVNGTVDIGAVETGTAPPPPSGVFGDFTGDGKADILWRHAATGANAVWFMNSATRTGAAATTPVADPNWRVMPPARAIPAANPYPTAADDSDRADDSVPTGGFRRQATGAAPGDDGTTGEAPGDDEPTGEAPGDDGTTSEAPGDPDGAAALSAPSD